MHINDDLYSRQQPVAVPLVAKHRLSPESYAQLLRQVTSISVSNDTSVLQAGYQLGVQAVLQKLREGFVVGA